MADKDQNILTTVENNYPPPSLQKFHDLLIEGLKSEIAIAREDLIFRVDVPGVGQVNFPAGMEREKIEQACKRADQEINSAGFNQLSPEGKQELIALIQANGRYKFNVEAEQSKLHQNFSDDDTHALLVEFRKELAVDAFNTRIDRIRKYTNDWLQKLDQIEKNRPT